MSQSSTATFHMKRDPMILSYSGIASYQRCRHSWKLQNVYGLRTPLGTRPMDVGSATHAGIEHFLKGLGTAQAGVDAWVAETLNKTLEDAGDAVADHLEDVRLTAHQTTARVLREIEALGLQTFTKIEPLPVEVELQVKVPGWDAFAGHIDWIATDPQGRVWVVDFKTRSTFYAEDSEEVNLQNAIYQYLVSNVYGIIVDGTITFQVRSDRGREPKMNKNGTMSKAAIVCDWETYRAALVENGLDPADYTDMEDKLSTVEFTRVLKATRTEKQLRTVWNTVVMPLAVEMARVRDRAMSDDAGDRTIANRQAQRTLSQRTCSGCSVRDVCLNSLNGWDVQSHLARFDYRKPLVSLAAQEGTL